MHTGQIITGETTATGTTTITDSHPSKRVVLSRRSVLSAAGLAVVVGTGWPSGRPAAARVAPSHWASGHDTTVATAWAALVLRLVQGTPGFSPPVASRAMAYVGEAVAVALDAPAGPGQQTHTRPHALPAAPPQVSLDGPLVANACLARVVRGLFVRAPDQLRHEVDELERRLDEQAGRRVPRGVQRRSRAHGADTAESVLLRARDDGGHEGDTRNFPDWYTPPVGPGLWVPTPPDYQSALLPSWGSNRCIVLRDVPGVDPGPPPPFSTEPGSATMDEAVEVWRTVGQLDDEQLAIARFWADDPGTTPTPPGHSFSILTQVLAEGGTDLIGAATAYRALGAAVCDAFIACWWSKYTYNRIRPITFIRSHLEPGWGDPLPVTTPPFPEHTSGHSVQAGAAATVLTALFGDRAFTDHTHQERGLPARRFASFREAAEEAAISRLYGGIHFRAAIEMGLAQGETIGAACVDALVPA